MATRRAFIHWAAAALPAFAPQITFASAKTRKRLIVIILRGGADGLDVLQPVGDSQWKALRPDAFAGAVVPGSFFALHPGLDSLLPMFTAREMLAVHSVSIPFHSRSHFEAQDILEWGVGTNQRQESGWLNRLAQELGGEATDVFAADVNTSPATILSGPSRVMSAYPDVQPGFWANNLPFLEMLYDGEPEFSALAQQVRAQAALEGEIGNEDPGNSLREIAILSSKLLLKEARLVTFSSYGWDTHVAQSRGLNKNLPQLALALTSLREQLLPVWEDTLGIVISEFGRTARLNGTGGTDHGTGGLALFFGGALANGAGGQVLSTRWPGLGDDKLFEGRDLAPTDDVRRYVGWAIQRHFGLSAEKVTSMLFPGVTMGARLRIV